jgi:23S rRNA pseudouridine1911/1915/1917 synthase
MTRRESTAPRGHAQTPESARPRPRQKPATPHPAPAGRNRPGPKRGSEIELGNGKCITILYEDRSVLAVDKPAGWMLVPVSWQRTGWNLQAALMSSIAAGAFWARSRGLRFLRYVHRLDAETSGILLLGRSPGAVEALGTLFESRRVQKAYLAIVHGTPKADTWTCQLPLGPDPQAIGRVRADPRDGKAAETAFRVIATQTDARCGPLALIEARPLTGRTHQIRVHLATDGLPVLGDPLYGTGMSNPGRTSGLFPMALRAVRLEYRDPFTRRPVQIAAPETPFLAAFGFPTTRLSRHFRSVETERKDPKSDGREQQQKMTAP